MSFLTHAHFVEHCARNDDRWGELLKQIQTADAGEQNER